MKIEEAKECLRAIRVRTFYDGESKWTEALDIATEALEHQQKYRWHDLRKNPNDLPNGNCYCCVLVEDGEYAICEYSVDCKCFGETVTEKHYELQSEPVESWFEGFDEDFIAIAWREIEPFEEGEEE